MPGSNDLCLLKHRKANTHPLALSRFIVFPCHHFVVHFFLQEVPPYNFHGTLDDSMQNVRMVVPSRPRRDYIKYMDNQGKALRYEAKLVGWS